MDPLYHNSPPSTTFIDLNEEQPQQDHLFNLNTQISSSLSLSPPLLMINNPPQDHGEFFYKEPQRFQLQAPLEADHHRIFSYGGSCDDHHPRVADQSESENSDDLKLTIWKNDVPDHTNDHKSHMNIMSSENFDDSVKWTSSKMRMMRKMIITNPDHQTISTNDHHNPINFTHKIDHQAMKKHTPTSPFGADHSTSSSSNNTTNNNGTIRVCSDCNTTKTPLWRSGPRGPKSLCNACGIRQRKARRAMAAAAAAANGTIVAVDATAASMKTSAKVKHKEKKTKVGRGNGNCVNPQFKKRCNKLTSPPSRGRKKLLCFEDLRISMSKSSAFNRVFPQDEKDAAILLMALSYGLVHG